MRSGVWSKRTRVGTAAVSAALLVGLAGCGGAAGEDVEAAAPSEAVEAQGLTLALADALVDERPVVGDLEVTDEVKDFPDYEERLAIIEEGLDIAARAAQTNLTPGEYSEEPYDQLQELMANKQLFDDYYARGREGLREVIPTLLEDDTLPEELVEDVFHDGKLIHPAKVVGEPTMRFTDSAMLGVDEPDEYNDRGELLYAGFSSFIELPLEDGTTATYYNYLVLGSTEEEEPDELWSWWGTQIIVGMS